MRASFGLPMEFDKNRVACLIDQTERMHAKALHGGVAARQRAVRHLPDQHVR